MREFRIRLFRRIFKIFAGSEVSRTFGTSGRDFLPSRRFLRRRRRRRRSRRRRRRVFRRFCNFSRVLIFPVDLFKARGVLSSGKGRRPSSEHVTVGQLFILRFLLPERRGHDQRQGHDGRRRQGQGDDQRLFQKSPPDPPSSNVVKLQSSSLTEGHLSWSVGLWQAFRLM